MHVKINIGLDESGPQELTVVDANGERQELHAALGGCVLEVPKGHVVQIVPGRPPLQIKPGGPGGAVKAKAAAKSATKH